MFRHFFTPKHTASTRSIVKIGYIASRSGLTPTFGQFDLPQAAFQRFDGSGLLSRVKTLLAAGGWTKEDAFAESTKIMLTIDGAQWIKKTLKTYQKGA